ncbi:MAG: hypothetical protein LIP01_03690 [Tannerellaceae bacterium]|nr:hypothetical protein [Tannerellaceae bacterium]
MEYQDRIIDKNQSIVSVGNWILTMVILCIPIVNIIMLFVWAFGHNTPVGKSNYVKAMLILWVILLLISLIFWGPISRYMYATYPGMI